MMRQALLSWLFAFVFFTGLSVGSLMLLQVHALTGGAWGTVIRPHLAAAAGVLPVLALVSVVLLIGAPQIYSWPPRSWYLNPPFFTLRTLAYFAVWLLCLTQMPRRPGLAAPGLIACVVTASLAAVDWLMSLQPQWRSTAFGIMVATGWTLSAAALATLWATRRGTPRTLDAALCNDLGNLLLALLLGWSYLAFMQYLTIWIADLPVETSWYLIRTQTNWRVWTALLVVFHFLIPFAVLLSRQAKRRPWLLAAVAALLLVAHLAHALWLVLPDVHPQAMALHWTDIALPVMLAALWLAVFRRPVHV